MLTILVPCAGDGRRFREAGYEQPKPLIDIHGKPMLQRVIENLNPPCPVQWVFITKTSHCLSEHIPKWVENSTVIQIDKTTKGAACTCLLVKDIINTDQPLIISNCDQLIGGDYIWLCALIPDSWDRANAKILTMKGDESNKWSYVRVSHGLVTQVVEKNPISDRATCGIYAWRKGADFVKAAEKMIAANDTVNGEFYVAPTFNYLNGSIVREVKVESYGAIFHGLGTPEDLETYLKRGQ